MQIFSNWNKCAPQRPESPLQVISHFQENEEENVKSSKYQKQNGISI